MTCFSCGFSTIERAAAAGVFAFGLVHVVHASAEAGPYVAVDPQAYLGRVVGAGYCVDFVKAAAAVPNTASWRPGIVVKGNHGRIGIGTAIATFEDDGTYTSRTGNHAAIYLGQDEIGVWVYDQWRGRSVHRRQIRFGGENCRSSSKSNCGDRFAVIE